MTLIDRLMKRHFRWVAIDDMAASVLDEPRSEIQSRLTSSSLTTTSLEIKSSAISNYLSIRGITNLWGGENQAWTDANHGLTWRLFCFELRLKKLSLSNVVIGTDVNWVVHSILQLAHLTVVGQRDLAAKMVGVFLDLVVTDERSMNYFLERDAEPACCYLILQLVQREHPALSDFDYGQYRFVVEALAKGRPLLSDELSELCDYHCENNEDSGDDEIPPFRDAPYDVIPVEILLIKQVFEARGIPFPDCDHPLWKSPFVPVPKFIPGSVNDDLLLQVAKHFHCDDIVALLEPR